MMGYSPLSKEDRAKRNRQIVRLGKEKMRPYLIVQAVPGATHAVVNNVLFQARLNGEVEQIGVRGRYCHSSDKKNLVNIPPDIAGFLKPAAAARKISITELARHILIAVTDARIVDAVLDDGVATP